MRRVEFLGVEGIGKTTLYNELIRKRGKKDNWITLDEASDKIACKYSKERSRTSFIHLIASILLRFPFQKHIKSSLCDLILQMPQEEAVRQNGSYHLFFQSIMDFCNVNQYSQQLRLYRITELYKFACRIIYLESNDNSDLVVVEGGAILAYGLLMSHWLEDCEDMVRNFFLNTPPPTGIIYCKLNSEETINRIQRRKESGIITLAHRDSKNHKSLVENNQLQNIIKNQSDMAAIGVKALKNKGVLILEIDMGDTQEKNILKIRRFLSELNVKY